MGRRCWRSHDGRRGSRYLRRWTGHYDHRQNHQDHHPISLALGCKTKTISNIGRKKLCLAKSDFAFTTTSFRPQSTDVTRTRTTRNRKYGHGSAHFFERRITLAVTILSVFVEIPNTIPNFELLTKKTKFETKKVGRARV